MTWKLIYFALNKETILHILSSVEANNYDSDIFQIADFTLSIFNSKNLPTLRCCMCASRSGKIKPFALAVLHKIYWPIFAF